MRTTTELSLIRKFPRIKQSNVYKCIKYLKQNLALSSHSKKNLFVKNQNHKYLFSKKKYSTFFNEKRTF